VKSLKSFWSVVDWQTFAVTGLALLATFLCNHYAFSAELPSGLIGIAIIFPIVFSINAAYRRREEVLRYFASLKAHGMALYYAHADWGGDNPTRAERFEKLFLSILEEVKNYFASQKRDDIENKKRVFESFKEVSKSNEMLRDSGIAATEISRVNQYLRSMIIDFEKMRNVKLYQTPKSLRAYSQIFLNLFPILYAPYFAHICLESHIYSGYAVAAIYSLVLVTLDNIQEDLEDPFDGVGEDDVKLEVASDYRKLFQTKKAE
jgi:hypothetical protein